MPLRVCVLRGNRVKICRCDTGATVSEYGDMTQAEKGTKSDGKMGKGIFLLVSRYD